MLLYYINSMKKHITNLEILKAYDEHLKGVDLADLSRKYNVSWHSLYACFKRRNFKIIKGLHRNLKYRNNLKEDYFDIINTHEKSYFLGLLMSDGYIRSKSNEIGLKLKKSDINIDELFDKIF